MKNGCVYVAILLVTAPLPAAADESPEPIRVDVEQAVQLALENNINLAIEEIELGTHKRTMNNRWNAILPEVNASIGAAHDRNLFGNSTISGSSLMADPDSELSPGSGVYDRVISSSYESELQPTSAVNAGIRMNLPINFGIIRQFRQTVLDFQSGLLSLERARKEMEIQVRKQFWFIRVLQAGLELDIQNLENLQDRYEQNRVNYENGLVTELSLLSSRVSLENARPLLMAKKAELANTMAEFKSLLAVPREQEIILQGDIQVEIYDLQAEQLIQRFAHQRFDIRNIDQQILSMENQKTVTTLFEKSPTINLGLSWRTGVNDKPLQAESWEQFTDNLSLSADISIPLDGFIPGSSTDLRIREMEDAISSLRLSRALAVDRSGIEIENLVRRLENAKAGIEAYKVNHQLALRSYELNTQAFRLGSVDLSEVEQAQDELYQAEYSILYEKYNYLTALLDLEYAINGNLEGILDSSGSETGK